MKNLALSRRLVHTFAASWLGLLATPAFGQLSYVGSSTIGEIIMPEAARAFREKTGIAVDVISMQGSGKGLEAVLSGAAPLAGVSRALSRAEKQQRIYYLIIGYDAVGVFVHPTNPVRELSRSQLKAIHTGEITSWKQVGGQGGPIVAITQIWGAKRAQMIEFQQHVMDNVDYRADRKEVDRQVDQVEALRVERRGITAVSLAFARPGITAIAIEGFTVESRHIRSGAYILSRPLVLVASVPPTPEAKAFMDFMLSPEGQAIVARRFVPLSAGPPK